LLIVSATCVHCLLIVSATCVHCLLIVSATRALLCQHSVAANSIKGGRSPLSSDVFSSIHNTPHSLSHTTTLLCTLSIMSAPIQCVYQDCAICTEKVLRHQATRLVCDHGDQHYFHAECIIEWFKISTSCPSCRSTFKPNEISSLIKHPNTTYYSSVAAEQCLNQINTQMSRLYDHLSQCTTRQERKKIMTSINELIVAGDDVVKAT
jgi:hypothetical protein